MEYEIKCQVCGTKLKMGFNAINQKYHCTFCQNDFVVPLTSVSAGMVQGDYWIQRRVGSGNISEVFVAKRTSDNSKVFLKVLTPGVTQDQSRVEQFMIEMCRSHQVDNPHVVSAFETGRFAGHYYLATPYIEGECLDTRVQRTGPVSEKEALKIALKVARLLRTCWQQYGVVHRSLRPSNIMLNETGEVYLLDMGNSKRILAPAPESLESLNYQGTVADYMSPEQAQGMNELDYHNDMYALGATIFYLITGTKPYSGSDTTQVLKKHLNARTPDARKRSDEVSIDTAKLLQIMMSKHAEDRPTNWHTAIKRIKHILKSNTHGAGTSQALQPQFVSSSEPGRIPKPNSDKRLIVAGLIAAASLFMISGLAVIAMINRQQPTQPVVAKPHRLDPASLQAEIVRLTKLAEREPAQRQDCILKLRSLKKQTYDPGHQRQIDSAIARLRGGQQSHTEPSRTSGSSFR